MANMTTVLDPINFSDNLVVYTAPSHTSNKAQLVRQKRRPGSATKTQSDTIQTVFDTEDAGGDKMANPIVFETIVRYLPGSKQADIDAALALHREVVASDNFTGVVNKSSHLQ